MGITKTERSYDCRSALEGQRTTLKDQSEEQHKCYFSHSNSPKHNKVKLFLLVFILCALRCKGFCLSL